MSSIKIGFILASNSRQPLPSTRVAVLNMFPFLRANDFEPHVVFEPSEPTESPVLPDLAPRLIAEGFRLVFFQKVTGPSVLDVARKLSAAGVKTVFGVCDLLDVSMVEATDMTITVT